jgi:hypothetical protein
MCNRWGGTAAEIARPVEPAAKTTQASAEVAVAPVPSDERESESEASAISVPTRGTNGVIPLRVLYLARSDEERTRAFVNLFEEHFQAAASVQRDEFVPAQADQYDVVVLDWSQDERSGKEYPSPLGDLANWNTPTVMLGSAGLINAGPWHVLGGAG